MRWGYAGGIRLRCGQGIECRVHRSRGQAYPGRDDDALERRGRCGLQHLTASGGPLRTAADEERHVRPHGRAGALEALRQKAETQQFVGAAKNGRGVA